MLLGIDAFIQARNYTPVPTGSPRPIRNIVMHTMESPEKPGTARAVAKWFAGETAPKASAHFCIDADEIIQCVDVQDVAWHAPGLNRVGIGIELAGRAGQNTAEWGDDLSRRMLERAAALVAQLMREYMLSPARLTPTELRAGFSGLCGHVDVSKAFGKSTHWDPGPSFPWDGFLLDVSKQIAIAR